MRNMQSYCIKGVPGWSCCEMASGRCGAPLPMAQPTRCDLRPRLQAQLWKRRQTGRGGPGRRFPSSRGEVIDRVGPEDMRWAGELLPTPPEMVEQMFGSPRPNLSVGGEGVTNHADATSTFGGPLELAQVSVVRPVLGGRMRAAHRPALALGALHLRTNTHGHQHHARGRGLLPQHGDR